MAHSAPFHSLAQARDALMQGKIGALELMRLTIQRIDQLQPALRPFLQVFADESLEKARKMEDSGVRPTAEKPLAGLPIVLKDNLCTSWGRTTCASRMLENYRSPFDATVVRRLLDAGAIVVGKTNLDEFAMGSSTENSAFGPTGNPWDPTRVPGGSSGGTACAVSAGMGLAGLGSDTGGSIRQPAALCGIVGLKPTYGRVSRYGLVAFASSLDQVGPMTRTVTDCSILLQAIAGHDRMDATSIPQPPPDYLAELEKPLDGVRIGVVRDATDAEGIDPSIRRSFDQAVRIYQNLGAKIVDIVLPHQAYGIAAYYIIAPCEASSNLARYDGVHFGHRTARPVQSIPELFSLSRSEGFGAEVQRRILIGTYALSAGYYDALYVRALRIRRLIRDDFDRAFRDCDVILTPTTPSPAFRIGEKSGDPLQLYLCDIFTVTCNIAGIPGISIPCGFTEDHPALPIGMQLLGPPLSEPLLLRTARIYERETEWHLRAPPC
jgi:aspartyl-tRNA(Asn)/glutamyl-tRNA(Gln) amidotransferase subunit A